MDQLIAQPHGGRSRMRDRDELPANLPVILRSACHHPISKGRFRQPWSKRLVLIKWVISGEAAIRVGGRQHSFKAGDVAVHVPTIPHAFWAVAPISEMCWFSVDGPLAEQFAYLLGLRAGVYPYGPAPVDAIEGLIDCLADQSSAGHQRSSLQAIRLLYEVVQRLTPPPVSSVLRQVRHLVREGLADPELSAREIATQLNYNRSSLSRMFHRHTGMTIMDCITQTRLEEAKMLLARTEERVTDIAVKCGFRDVSYFSRWVRKHTGRSPHDLRDLEL
jgi:AraC-like DNA-binding protein